jgi:hypothetical protein
MTTSAPAAHRLDAGLQCAISGAHLRALLARVYRYDGRDAELSDDLWWELVDVPTGAARTVNGVREINYTAGDPGLKPFWRPVGVNHFGNDPDGLPLIDSLDRVIALANRALNGWKWQLYSGGGPDNDKCFACVHSKLGAFSALHSSSSAALVAAILEAKIAVAQTADAVSSPRRDITAPRDRPNRLPDLTAPAATIYSAAANSRR